MYFYTQNYLLEQYFTITAQMAYPVVPVQLEHCLQKLSLNMQKTLELSTGIRMSPVALNLQDIRVVMYKTLT